MQKGIWVMNHSGHEPLCENGKVTGAAPVSVVDSGDGDVSVSFDALQAFMDSCIAQYGYAPMVSGRKVGGGDGDFDLLHRAGMKEFKLDRDALIGVEAVLVSNPLAGG